MDKYKEMPALKHVAELRKRLLASLAAALAGMVLGFIFYEQYIDYLKAPLGPDLYFHSIIEPFLLKLKISVYAGLIISFPVHLYNVVAFILPALTPKERRALKCALFASFILILMGLAISYLYVLPWAVSFMQRAQFNPEGVGRNIHFSDAVMFELKLILAFMALFQLPLLLEVLMALNVLSRRTLLRSSRYVIVIIFVLSAVLTPPEIISQISLAIPLIFLFYLSIFVAWIFGFGRAAD